jgi:tRNA wybutosine-synthesizing protein 4
MNDWLRSCVELGYYADPFVSKFLPRFRGKRFAPLIHRGYYLRVRAVRTLLTHFIQSCRRKELKAQVVSLGAGFDTNYWIMENDGTAPDMFMEVDLPEVVVKKASILQRNADLRKAAGLDGPIRSPTSIQADHYVLRAVDIRDASALEKAIEDVIDPSAPVLLLAECVFAYMKSEETEAILRYSLLSAPINASINASTTV